MDQKNFLLAKEKSLKSRLYWPLLWPDTAKMAMESEELDIYDIYGDSLGLFGEAAVAQGSIS